MKQWQKRTLRIAAALVLLIVLTMWLHWENQALMVTEIEVTSEELPESFEGYRVAQISDLHNTQFGKENGRLIQMLKATKPDIIVLTGDLVDSRKTDLEVGIAFGEEAVKIAPTYYVTGNHEERMRDSWKLLSGLEQAGVTILRNRGITLEKDGQSITLLGIDDPGSAIKTIKNGSKKEKQSLATRKLLMPLMQEQEGFTILLAHRPEVFDVYVESGVDLVFSGHLHGGQFRLPYLGGLFTFSQGFFPEYDAGLYEEDGTQMIVSRGLGNSLFPFRLNNRPEIILAILIRE